MQKQPMPGRAKAGMVLVVFCVLLVAGLTVLTHIPDEPQPSAAVAAMEEAKEKLLVLTTALHCQQGADDYLRSVAGHDFKWAKIGVLHNQFAPGNYVTGTTGNTIFPSQADVLMQNGNGAYDRMTLYCIYDHPRGWLATTFMRRMQWHDTDAVEDTLHRVR